MKKYISFICLALIIFSVSCKKDLITEKNNFFTTIDTSKSSFIKVFIGTVKASNNYVYADNVPLTGARIGLGLTFPANLGYSIVAAGTRSILIKDTVPTTTQVPVTISQNFEAGKYYSIFTYDTITNVKYKVVQDNFVISDDTTNAQLRFANLIYSKNTIPTVDVYSQNLSKNIFTNVDVAAITDFVQFPGKVADSFFVRENGKLTNIAALGFIPGAQRAYTLVANGRYQSSTKTFPTLSVYTNR